MSPKRIRSPPSPSQANQHVTKIPRHRRSNSGSVPESKLDKVIVLMEKLVDVCTQLEGLFIEAGEDLSEEQSTQALSLPTGLLNTIVTTIRLPEFAKWMAQLGVSGNPPENSLSGQVISEEREQDDELDSEVEELEVTNLLSFSYLNQIVRDLDKNVKQLKVLRDQAGLFAVEIIPFSSIVATDYEKLAIMDRNLNVKLSFLWKEFSENPTGTTLLDKMTYEVTEKLTTELSQVWKDYMNPWSEMTARKVIEVYFDFIRSPDIFPESTNIITSPEFGILGHAKSKEPNRYPVINIEKSLKTYLNGSTDYLTILIAGLQLRRHLKRGQTQWRSKSGQKSWLENMMTEAGSNDQIRLSVCEAKWPGARLEKHIPQVVAEAIGLQLNTKRRFVPFCLSNGLEWIFGAVQACGNPDSASNRFWASEVIQVKTDQLATAVLLLLRFWAVVPELAVWNLGCCKDSEWWASDDDASGPAVPVAPMQGVQVASSGGVRPLGGGIEYKFPPVSDKGKSTGGRVGKAKGNEGK